MGDPEAFPSYSSTAGWTRCGASTSSWLGCLTDPCVRVRSARAWRCLKAGGWLRAARLRRRCRRVHGRGRARAAVLVGASSGGYVAQRFAVDNPGRTLGLALLGSPRSLRGPRPPFADVVATLEDPMMRPLPVSSAKGWSRREVPEAVMATLCEENLKVPARVWRDASRGCSPPNHRSTPAGSPRQP